MQVILKSNNSAQLNFYTICCCIDTKPYQEINKQVKSGFQKNLSNCQCFCIVDFSRQVNVSSLYICSLTNTRTKSEAFYRCFVTKPNIKQNLPAYFLLLAYTKGPRIEMLCKVQTPLLLIISMALIRSTVNNYFVKGSDSE